MEDGEWRMDYGDEAVSYPIRTGVGPGKAKKRKRKRKRKRKGLSLLISAHPGSNSLGLWVNLTPPPTLYTYHLHLSPTPITDTYTCLSTLHLDNFLSLFPRITLELFYPLVLFVLFSTMQSPARDTC